MRFKSTFFPFRSVAAIAVVALFSLLAIAGSPLFGAIFTTNESGERVNQNIYDNQFDVYLNGGPNNATSRGLPPDETFYYEVTDPSGKTLLSTDAAICRQLRTNADGRVFDTFVDAGCFNQHNLGATDPSNGSTSIQLYPFSKTPNNGGEYKVTLIRKDDADVSIADDGNHINYPKSASKSDNYKIREYIDKD